MPMYEYECQRCGRLFDVRRGVSDSDSEIECPTCGAKNPKRLLSRFTSCSPESGCRPTRGFT